MRACRLSSRRQLLYVEGPSDCLTDLYYFGQPLANPAWVNGSCPEPFVMESNKTVYCNSSAVVAILEFVPLSYVA